jgi:hypothetical protein
LAVSDNHTRCLQLLYLCCSLKPEIYKHHILSSVKD